jgi:plasmid maintenance system killer protein
MSRTPGAGINNVAAGEFMAERLPKPSTAIWRLPSNPVGSSSLKPSETAPDLDLAFKTKRLRRICENQHAAELAFPSEVAAQLRDRLADMDAAERASDLVAGSPREKSGLLIVDLASGYTLSLRANHNSVPRLAGGGIDWRRVKRLQVVSIGVPNV